MNRYLQLSNPMNAFLGLLAAVVGLMIVITLSIMELWVIPWPILLILLLLTLWISQRLIDRFNPAPVEGFSSGVNPSQDKSTAVTRSREEQVFSPERDPQAELAHLQYRGQVYDEVQPLDSLLEEAVQEAKPSCYRGIRLQDQCTSTDSEESCAPKHSVPHPPQLSYRGVKRSQS